ncbi:hypothetical protein [Halanaeroarchaeum sulfurireducens]|uniref:Uncharacterized protein n=1 Tax=Halanaeroarchaeum sulfurireducens TaxID=1604004 RepID=A0A0F7PDN6_9EURY|nr:hypothetical protein [Halanaeroarchaeum sulfurireducens]AKH97448.1 hypothetical protein HLASF_0958 [Halanaeroarchaeum sulfurireducens]
MLNSKQFEDDQRRNTERRRAMIKQWAEYVRTHDDSDWSHQQNRLINSQLQSANEMAGAGETDPVRFGAARDRLDDR